MHTPVSGVLGKEEALTLAFCEAEVLDQSLLSQVCPEQGLLTGI